MAPLISIIIPFYNGEIYIEKCLESIRRQEYSNKEILIIDDGSKSESVKKIEEYSITYQFPITIIHQKNQGQGAARNTGIQNANGKYIVFMDQDDTMEMGTLAKMVLLAEKENADVVSAGYRRVTKQGKIKKEVRLKNTEWSKYQVITPWSKLYLREFLLLHNILFLPTVLGEDIYFLMNVYSYSPKLVIMEEVGYNWLDNEISVSNTAHKELTAETSLLKLYNMLEKIECIEVLKKDKLYEYFLIKTAIWNILYTARKNTFSNVLANSNRIWEWMETHFSDYRKNPNIKLNKPNGEDSIVRMLVWGYMLLKKLKLEKVLLRIISC